MVRYLGDISHILRRRWGLCSTLERSEDDDERVFVSSVEIQPGDGIARYEVTVTPEFFRDGSEIKFEVLAREASFNQTAVESCMFEFVED